MRYRVLPYRQGSKGAKKLSEAILGHVLKLEGSTFKPRTGDVVINWGNTDPSFIGMFNKLHFAGASFYNTPQAIKSASNKLRFFGLMQENNSDIIPRWWTTRSSIPSDAYPVVCRTVLAGHSGDGIVIANSADELVDAMLFIEYRKKKEEYRIHVGRRGEDTVLISIQRKARRKETPSEEVNWQVRNHANGFVYVRSGVNPPVAVTEAAVRALKATGLDFGAVDVIWNDQESRAYVLEINTAPGLEGTTVTDYAKFFKPSLAVPEEGEQPTV